MLNFFGWGWTHYDIWAKLSLNFYAIIQNWNLNRAAISCSVSTSICSESGFTKGAGGSKLRRMAATRTFFSMKKYCSASKIYWEWCPATRNFFRNEKILFLAKVNEFLNPENKLYNYIVCANLNCYSPKIHLLLQFLR